MCLVQTKYAPLAAQRIDQLVAADGSLKGRITLSEGDITAPGLGLHEGVLGDVTEAWHLAAVYDLAVDRALGVRVNVDGTRNVLDALERCPKLERLHYFSTCFVSGRYAGPFSEDDLDVGAPFSNFYEETKHLAEVEVRRRMAAGLPPRSTGRRSSSATAVRARPRSTTAPTSSCSGCCASPRARSCRSPATPR